jgi:hypothetical protein
VSDAASVHHFVANLSNQPVELYLPSGLRVLPPRSRAEIPAADLQSRQLQVLQASRLVMIDQSTAPAEAEPAPKTPHAPDQPASETQRPDHPKAEG